MKILVVDDEKDIKTLFQQRFRKEIKDNLVEFVFTFSGEEALDYLSLHEHEHVDRPERKILGSEVFQLFDSPSSLSTMLFDAQAYYRDTAAWL